MGHLPRHKDEVDHNAKKDKADKGKNRDKQYIINYIINWSVGKYRFQFLH